MAKPHGSVRIGPISLFTLIIILCLAVLAVLSLTTARAQLTITDRQALTTYESYQLEMQGQRFVAEVDGALAGVRGAQPTDQAIRAALEPVCSLYGVAAVEAAAGDGGAAAAGDAGDGDAGAADDGAGAAGDGGDGGAAGETIADETPSGQSVDDGSVQYLTDEGATVSVSGTYENNLITTTFSLENGRTLIVVLRINDNATYTIEQWKTTTQWTDDGTGENLWLG